MEILLDIMKTLKTHAYRKVTKITKQLTTNLLHAYATLSSTLILQVM